MRLKKIASAALAAACCAALLSGCARLQGEKSPAPELGGGQDIFTAQLGAPEPEYSAARDFKRAVWISYLDLSEIITGDSAAFEKNLESVIANLASIKTTDIFLQVRAFGEALYISEVFPAASSLYGGYNGDIDYLGMFVEAAHESGMRLHAWINPYRLGGVESETYVNFESRLSQENGRAALALESGGFINPASGAARELIVADIAALCKNYAVDGVQFDDYFYPSADETLDEADYAAYKAGGGAMSLADWRRENVSALVRDTYSAVHEGGAERVFGVSPDASIERNRGAHFADVERWCAESGFIDYICPQIYYGYKNETRPFDRVMGEWKALCVSCELLIGISAYKTGAEDRYAGSGALEWRENFDIVARQYADARDDGAVSGAAFFRYGSLFAPDESVEAFANLELYALRKETSSE